MTCRIRVTEKFLQALFLLLLLIWSEWLMIEADNPVCPTFWSCDDLTRFRPPFPLHSFTVAEIFRLLQSRNFVCGSLVDKSSSGFLFLCIRFRFFLTAEHADQHYHQDGPTAST